jgi:hypothetical protein
MLSRSGPPVDELSCLASARGVRKSSAWPSPPTARGCTSLRNAAPRAAAPAASPTRSPGRSPPYSAQQRRTGLATDGARPQPQHRVNLPVTAQHIGFSGKHRGLVTNRRARCGGAFDDATYQVLRCGNSGASPLQPPYSASQAAFHQLMNRLCQLGVVSLGELT